MAAQRDELLLRLQQTIQSWSGEVTEAHQSLTRQIGEAKEQLGTLIDTLAPRPAPTSLQEAQTYPPVDLREDAIQDALGRSEELESKVQALESQLTRITNRAEELSRENETIQTELETVRAERDENRSRAAAADEAQRKLTAESDALKRDLERLSRELESNNAIIEGLREDVRFKETQIERLEGALGSLQEGVEERGKQVELLRQERASLEEELQRALEERQTGLSQTESLRRRLEERELALETLQTELDSLRQQEQQKSERIARLEEEVAAARAEAGKTFESGQAVARVLDEVRAQISEKESALQRVQNELITARREGGERESAYQTELYERQRQIADLEARLASTQQQIADLRDADASVDDHFREELESLRRRESEAESRIQEKQLIIEQLEQQVSQKEALERKNVELEQTIAKLKHDIDTLRRHAAPVEELAGAASPDHPVNRAASPDELETIRRELLTFETMLVEREKAVQVAAEKMRNMEATARQVRSDLNALREVYESQEVEANKEIEKLRGEVLSLREALLTSERQTVEYRKTLAAKEDVLAQLREDMDALLLEADPGLGPGEAPESMEDARARIRTLEAALSDREARITELERAQERSTEEPGDTRIAEVAFDSAGRKRSMGEILVNAGIITQDQLSNALEEQRHATQRRLGAILVEKGLIREEMVAQVLASQLRLPFVRLREERIDAQALTLLNARLAMHHACIPLRADDKTVTVAMANPLDLIAIEDLEFATRKEVKPVVATQNDIAQAITQHYGLVAAESLDARRATQPAFDTATEPPPLEPPSI